MTPELLLATGIASCAAAIVHLYVRLEKKHTATEERLTACERDRDKLWQRIATMGGGGPQI